MGFVHLHLHTTYSFLDGMIKPKELMNRLKELDMNAAAITDHGNMHGVVDFYQTAGNAGIKPILGIEAYISADSRKERVQGDAYHIVLLAENEVGYKNISYLTSHAFVDGFYYKPRIDKKLLEKFSEGLICLSACIQGEIPRLLLDDKKDQALEVLDFYKNIFGEDYYIEMFDKKGIPRPFTASPEYFDSIVDGLRVSSSSEFS